MRLNAVVSVPAFATEPPGRAEPVLWEGARGAHAGPAVAPQSLRVLMAIEDTTEVDAIVAQLQRAGYAVEWRQALTARDLRDALGGGVDVVLCAQEVESFNCLEALHLIREAQPSVPLIVLSGEVDEETVLAVVRAGAADWIRRDRLGRLASAVGHAVEQCRLRRERGAIMEALREAEARYRGLFENAVEGIFQATAEGRLLTANPAFARILHYASARDAIEAVADLLTQLCPDAPRRAELQAALEQTGLATAFETQAACRDGSRPWVSLNCRYVREPGGATHLEGTIEDITERKKLETQLLRSQRLESLGRLAGGIAHDLNNILLPILISPGLLRDRVRDEVSRDLVDSIEVSARRGADIVRQLLAFSRGTDGELVPVQLRTLVAEMLNIMRETFPKNINLRSALPLDIWSVRGDPTQLHQVIMNLCVNARDAMPQGGDLLLTLENCELDEAAARADAGARTGRHVLLRVCDTGTGIAPEHLDQIFDPFFTTKPLGQGTGLGLSTVLGIVQSHGGFIQIDSTLGQGTQFRVYVPACEQLAIHEPVRVSAGPRGHGELVLLVDDERAVREATRLMLERHGYRVVEARDGEDAIERLDQHGTDIAVAMVDLLMPRMDGVELIRQLRRRADGPLVLAMTGVGHSPKVTQVKRFGDVPLLEKPFAAETLLRALHQILPKEPDVAGRWGW